MFFKTASAEKKHSLSMITKVLIIDDDNSLQRLMRAHLKAHTSFDVMQATDGLSGLAFAKNDRPSLIILDWMLPDMDGIDVLKKLKRLKQTQHIPRGRKLANHRS